MVIGFSWSLDSTCYFLYFHLMEIDIEQQKVDLMEEELGMRSICDVCLINSVFGSVQEDASNGSSRR